MHVSLWPDWLRYANERMSCTVRHHVLLILTTIITQIEIRAHATLPSDLPKSDISGRFLRIFTHFRLDGLVTVITVPLIVNRFVFVGRECTDSSELPGG